jgi:cytochrome d ubiquinol oxidase subunit I
MMYRRAARLGAVFALVASLGVVVSGDVQGKIMTEVQPMKMASAEALYETESNASFSVFTVGSLDGDEEIFSVRIPGLLSFLATGSTSGTVEGINPLKEQAGTVVDRVSQQYGPEFAALVTADDYAPVIPVTYWSFRFMMGLGFLTMALAAAVLWATRKGGLTRSRWWVYVAVAAPLAPVFANSFGWIFTEVGRQPWIVNQLMTTATGVSPSVSASEVLTSMVAYTLVYAVLAIIEVRLFLLYVRRGADPFTEPVDPKDVDEDAPLQFAY